VASSARIRLPSAAFNKSVVLLSSRPSARIVPSFEKTTSSNGSASGFDHKMRSRWANAVAVQRSKMKKSR
jgi:hypothetical protein